MTHPQIEALFHQQLQARYPASEIDAILKYVIEQAPNAEKILLELKQGKPLQYILQEAHFHRYSFYVNEHVLIPRPETEELVELVRETCAHISHAQVLDACTGSGCIAVTLQNIYPNWNITGMDISSLALEVAQQNAIKYKRNINWIQDDLLNPKVEYPNYHIIVSNPPYIARREKADLAKHVVDFEPDIALFVEDKEPLIFYRALAHFAKQHLMKGGHLFCEINEKLGKETKLLFETFSFFKKIDLRSDFSGKHRFIWAQV